MDQYLPLLSVIAVVGSGLVSGLLFAFSNFVMQALRELPAEAGQQAMQRVNVRIINPIFLFAFMGSTGACALLVVLCVTHWGAPSVAWLMAGSLAYLVGPFGVTVAFNVPLNNILAVAKPHEATTAWPRYATRWLKWNHVRTGLGAVATTLLAIGLYQLGITQA
jgi:uncharacterized membrane protein